MTPDQVLRPQEPEPAPEAQPAAQPEPAPQPEKKSRRSQESAAREVEQHAQEVSQAIEEELAEPEEAYQYPPVTLLDQNSDDNYTEVGRSCGTTPAAWPRPSPASVWTPSPGTWSTGPASPDTSLPWTRG